MSARAIFDAEGIDVFYGTSQILFGVSLAVTEGQTMALLGRNGAGKSTTLKATRASRRRPVAWSACSAGRCKAGSRTSSREPGSAS